jgi:SAM-dependent methyltransferase
MSDPRANELRAGYASVARAYRDHLSDELTGKPLDRALLSVLADHCTRGLVVDIGCGPGHVARHLADRGVRIEGVDLSPAMIEQARAAHPDLTFREADMFALPYADASVRGAVLFYAIVHLRTEELTAPFRELHRVLEPRGVALVSFHVGTEIKHVDELFGCATSLDFMFHPPDDVVAALVAAGFTIEARLDRAPYPDAEYPSQRTYLLARK